MDDLEIDGESLQPAAKMPSTGNGNSIDNMKFQVEIVQQLEFTTSVANLQPQQISTNVTVKAMTNGSLKYEPQEMKSQMKMEPGKMQTMAPPPPPAPDILQDFKQEPDNEFADLDFGGLANFMANDENELKKLFSNISEVFDQDLFDQDKIKQEPRQPQNIPQMTQQNINQMNQLNQQFNQYVMPDSCQMQKPLMHQQPPQQQQQQQRVYQSQQVQQQIPEMSPAAQTLKNMAQQHQVKSSMAMNYMRPVGQPMVPQMNPQQQQQPTMAQRMPYQQQPQQQQFNDYNSQFHKNQIQMPFPPEMIKQEMMMQQQPQMAPMHQMKPLMNHQMMVHPNEDIKMNQQFQQYQNTQFVANHQPQQRNQFNPNQNTMNIHMKQTQMMHIQQGNGGGNIQMQGGQHMHFAGDMKMGDGGNFTMQQQQNMYFNHHTHQPNTHPQYGNMQAIQKRPQHHQSMGGGEGKIIAVDLKGSPHSNISRCRTNKHIQHDAESINEFHSVKCHSDAITANESHFFTQFHAQ
jgi:hypothetical protein